MKGTNRPPRLAGIRAGWPRPDLFLCGEGPPSIGDPPAVDAAGPGARLCEIKIVTLPIQVESGERKR